MKLMSFGWGALVSLSTVLLVGCDARSEGSEESDNSLARIWAHDVYFRPPVSDYDDQYGSSMDYADNVMVIGVMNEDSEQTTISGSDSVPSDDNASDRGAVYVYRRDSDKEWAVEAFIKPEIDVSNFGEKVATDGVTIAVLSDVPDNSPASARSRNTSKVHVYRNIDGTWTHESTLETLEDNHNDAYAHDFVVFGDYLAVTAPGTIRNSNGISTTYPASESVTSYYRGGVYVYKRDAGDWNFHRFLQLPADKTLEIVSPILKNIAYSDGNLVLGEPGLSSTDGARGYVSAADMPALESNASGSVFIFSESNGEFAFDSAIFGGDANLSRTLGFGDRVSVSGNTIALSVRQDKYDKNSVDNISEYTSLNTYGENEGTNSVVVYTKVNGQWRLQAHIKAPNIENGDGFGNHLEVKDDLLLIGAPFEDSSSTAILNGEGVGSNDEGAASAGAAYIYRRESNEWRQWAYLKSPTTIWQANFGNRVAIIDSETTLVSMPRAHGAGLGIAKGRVPSYTTENLSSSGSGDTGSVSLFKVIPNPALDVEAPSTSASARTGIYKSSDLPASITLSCEDTGTNSGGCSKTYFTTDGTTPKAGEGTTQEYSDQSISISQSEATTIIAYSVDTQNNAESPKEFTYDIDDTAPTFTYSAASTATTSLITLSCEDANGDCTVYFTLDGSTPTTSSAVYSEPFGLSSDTTIKYIAVDQAGNASSVQTETVTFVDLIGDIIDIESNGNTTIVLKSDGTVALWGDNLTGVLGHAPNTNGDTASVSGSVISSSYNPNAFTIAGLTDVVQVALGDTFALALKGDGTVWAWGQNEFYELGHEPGTNGDVTIETDLSFLDYDFDGLYWINPTPVQVSGLTNIVDIDAGSQHSLAVDSSGNVYAWGANTSGQLGDNSTTDSFSPVQVTNTAGTGVFGAAVAVNAGGNSSLVINEAGSLYGFGNNSADQLGLASAEYDTPQQILTSVSDADISGFSSVVLRNDGTVYHMGDVFSGIADGGGNPIAGYSTPTQVAGLSDMVEVRTNGVTTFATDVDGFTYAWGQNSYAQAGTNSTTDVTTPTLISVGSQTFVDIAKGYQHTAALAADGTLYLFGLNSFGQLGHDPNSNGDTLVNGDYYNQAGVTLETIESRILGAPQGVTAAGTTPGQLSVSWTAVTGATAYDVYYSTTPGVTPANGTVAANVTSGSSFSVPTPVRRYFVTVVAKDGSGNESVGSLEASAFVAAP